jgi:hypothetical protein
MIGGDLLILLKPGRSGLKSAKQAETRLANMLKVLRVALGKRVRDRRSAGRLWREFRWIWLIAVIRWPDHSIRPLNPAECPENIHPEGCDRIRWSILY